MRRIRYNARINKKDYNLQDVDFNQAVDNVAIQAISAEIFKQGVIEVFKEEFTTMKGKVIEIDAECYVMTKNEFEKLRKFITLQDIKGIIEILKTE